MYFKRIVFSLLLLGLPIAISAKEVPQLTSPVVDQAGLLSNQLQRTLINSLYQLRKQTSAEVALLTVKSLEGESIEGFAIKVVEQWKLGSQKQDNGILFLIAEGDRLMRIEVGQGLEGVLPDIKAGRIIQGATNFFKRGDYQSGIVFGLQEIAKSVGGELESTPKIIARRTDKGSSSLLFFMFVVIALFLGRRGGGGGLLAGVLLGSSIGSGRSSYGGGSFGGGGGFSGGGASGGW